MGETSTTLKKFGILCLGVTILALQTYFPRFSNTFTDKVWCNNVSKPYLLYAKDAIKEFCKPCTKNALELSLLIAITTSVILSALSLSLDVFEGHKNRWIKRIDLGHHFLASLIIFNLGVIYVFAAVNTLEAINHLRSKNCNVSDVQVWGKFTIGVMTISLSVLYAVVARRISRSFGSQNYTKNITTDYNQKNLGNMDIGII